MAGYTGLLPCAPRTEINSCDFPYVEETPKIGAWLALEHARKLPLPGLLEAVAMGGLDEVDAVETISMHAHGNFGIVRAKDAAHAMVLLHRLGESALEESQAQETLRGHDYESSSVMPDIRGKAMVQFADTLLRTLRSPERIAPREAGAILAGAGLLDKSELAARTEEGGGGAVLSAQDVSRIIAAINGIDPKPSGQLRELMFSALEELQYIASVEIPLTDVQSIASSLADMVEGDDGDEWAKSLSFARATEKILAGLIGCAKVDISSIKGVHVAEVARLHFQSGHGNAEVSSILAGMALRMSDEAFDLLSISTLLQALRGSFSNKNELYIKFSSLVLKMEPPASNGEPPESPRKSPAPELRPSLRSSSPTGGVDANKLSALSLLFSPSRQSGTATQSQQPAKALIPNLEVSSESPARSRVEAHQVASALSAFSSVGRMTLQLAKTFLVVLSQSCAAHSTYKRKVRIRDIASTLYYVVEWAKEGNLKEGHHLPDELTRLIAVSLREVHKAGAGDEEGSAFDVYEICKMLGPGTGQQGVGSCHEELLALAKKRASDPALKGGEGLLVLKAAEILADDSGQDDWVKEMLHRIDLEELERKRETEVMIGDSKQGRRDDADDSLSQLFTAFNKYGCSRGPLTTCALSELKRPPHHLSLERIVQCIKVLEGHMKSGGGSFDLPVESVARAISVQLCQDSSPSQSLLVFLIDFLSKAARCDLPDTFVGPSAHGKGVISPREERGRREIDSKEGPAKSAVYRALSDASLAVQRRGGKFGGGDAEQLVLSFGRCGYVQEAGELLAQILATSLATGAWGDQDVGRAVKVASNLFRIGLTWEEARSDFGAGVARVLEESVLASTSRLGKGISIHEASLALWYMGFYGGCKRGQDAVAAAVKSLHVGRGLGNLSTQDISRALEGMAVLRSKEHGAVYRLIRKASEVQLDAWNGIQLGSVCKAVAIFIAEEGRLGRGAHVVPRGVHKWIIRVSRMIGEPLKGEGAAWAYMYHLSCSASALVLEASKGNMGAVDLERQEKERENREQLADENDQIAGFSGGRGRDDVEGHDKPDSKRDTDSRHGIWSPEELESLRGAFEQSGLGRGRGKPKRVIEEIGNTLRVMGLNIHTASRDPQSNIVLDLCFQRGKRVEKTCVEVEGCSQRLRSGEWSGEVLARCWILKGYGWQVHEIDAEEWMAADSGWKERALLRGIAPLQSWATMGDEVLLLTMATEATAGRGGRGGVGDALWSAAVFRWRDLSLHTWAHDCIRKGIWKGEGGYGDGWDGEAALRYIVSSHFDDEMMGEKYMHTQDCIDVAHTFANLVRCCTLQGTEDAKAESMPEVFREVEMQHILAGVCPAVAKYLGLKGEGEELMEPRRSTTRWAKVDADDTSSSTPWRQERVAEESARACVEWLRGLRGGEAESFAASLASRLKMHWPPDVALRFSAFNRIVDCFQSMLEPVLDLATAMHTARWVLTGTVPDAQQRLALRVCHNVELQLRDYSSDSVLASNCKGSGLAQGNQPTRPTSMPEDGIDTHAADPGMPIINHFADVLDGLGLRFSSKWVCSQTGWSVDVAVNVEDSTLWPPLLKRCDKDGDGFISLKEFASCVEGTPLQGRWKGAWSLVSTQRGYGKPGEMMPDSMAILGRAWEGAPKPVPKDDAVCQGCGGKGHEAWECPRLFYEHTGLCMPGMTSSGFREKGTLNPDETLSPGTLAAWAKLRHRGFFKSLPSGAYARVDDLSAFLSTPFAILIEDGGVERSEHGLAGAELRVRQLAMAGWQVRRVDIDVWRRGGQGGHDMREEMVRSMLRVRYAPRMVRTDDA